MRRSGVWRWVALAVVVALVVTGGGFLIGRATSGSHHSASSPTTAVAAPSSSAPTTSSSDVTAVQQIPVVTCPTDYGVTGQNTGTPYPSTLPLTTTQAQAATLDYYTNDRSTLTPVLGPRGWTCQALLAADGGASVTVYPAGHPPSATSEPAAGQPLVEASAFGGCQGCIYGAICAIAPKAAPLLGYTDNVIACTPTPADQTTDWIKGSPESTVTADPDVIAYADPSTPDPTNGVYLFQYQTQLGARFSSDQCVLPAAQHALCTTILNQFIDADWRMSP